MHAVMAIVRCMVLLAFLHMCSLGCCQRQRRFRRWSLWLEFACAAGAGGWEGLLDSSLHLNYSGCVLRGIFLHVHVTK